MLGVDLSRSPTPVPGVPGLEALNINPEEAAMRYRERLIGPMRGVLPEAALANMEEQLSGPCTTETAAFDEFTALIGQPETAAGYDHVMFDAAPAGHTLPLMSLSKAWTGNPAAARSPHDQLRYRHASGGSVPWIYSACARRHRSF